MEWSEQEDLILAETVLRHITENSEINKAFDEAGKLLNRTAYECENRWNSLLRYKYIDAIIYADKKRVNKLNERRNEQRQREKEFYHRIESRKETIRKLVAEALERNDGALKNMAEGNVVYSKKADYTHDPYAEDELKQAQNLIKKLYNLLGQSADLDYKLWKETEKYCKDKGI